MVMLMQIEARWAKAIRADDRDRQQAVQRQHKSLRDIFLHLHPPSILLALRCGISAEWCAVVWLREVKLADKISNVTKYCQLDGPRFESSRMNNLLNELI
jgi:hypothetical protein